jgi:hypothetical protein
MSHSESDLTVVVVVAMETGRTVVVDGPMVDVGAVENRIGAMPTNAIRCPHPWLAIARLYLGELARTADPVVA